MKRFLVFGWMYRYEEDVDGCCGWNAFKGEFDTTDQARNYIVDQYFDQAAWSEFQLVDSHDHTIKLTQKNMISVELFRAVRDECRKGNITIKVAAAVTEGQLEVANYDLLRSAVPYHAQDDWLDKACKYNHRSFKVEMEALIRATSPCNAA